MTDYYKRTTAGVNYFGATGTTEPNMRQEMINTLQGSYPEIAKGRYFILRRMDRDSAGGTTPCGCIDEITKEPDKDKFCPFCFGSGMLFTEEYILAYKTLLDTTFSSRRRHDKMEAGNLDVPFVAFYTAYNGYITKEDKIVEVALNDDGTVIYPLKYLAVYEVDKAWDYHADNGKLEYYKVFTHKEEVKFISSPAYG
jgi:hypothetical protein